MVACAVVACAVANSTANATRFAKMRESIIRDETRRPPVTRRSSADVQAVF